VDDAHWGHHVKKKKPTILLYLCGGVEKIKSTKIKEILDFYTL
jgi:hypothetical protein